MAKFLVDTSVSINYFKITKKEVSGEIEKTVSNKSINLVLDTKINHEGQLWTLFIYESEEFNKSTEPQYLVKLAVNKSVNQLAVTVKHKALKGDCFIETSPNHAPIAVSSKAALVLNSLELICRKVVNLPNVMFKDGHILFNVFSKYMTTVVDNDTMSGVYLLDAAKCIEDLSNLDVSNCSELSLLPIIKESYLEVFTSK